MPLMQPASGLARVAKVPTHLRAANRANGSDLQLFVLVRDFSFLVHSGRFARGLGSQAVHLTPACRRLPQAGVSGVTSFFPLSMEQARWRGPVCVSRAFGVRGCFRDGSAG